ncbi:MAG TPA: LssY C-terminal domain-containing protein [Gemmataceae bacterium]|nr:LssY C-terminal domain-containing protein [Gemmataceae bacterium]
MELWHWLVALAVLWLLLAYFLLPRLWRRYARRHPALEDAPRITHTADGIHGDPLNVGLVGTEDELQAAMLAAGWFPADPITLKSSLRIALGTLLHRTYQDAPVSSLYLWGRKQDLAFEQPVGHDPRQRHHIRFWRSAKEDEQGRPLWIGAATFDTRVGLSHTTGQITHHIAADVDSERDKILADVREAGEVTEVIWVEDFHQQREGKNGGGDPYRTDGRLAVGIIVQRVSDS